MLQPIPMCYSSISGYACPISLPWTEYTSFTLQPSVFWAWSVNLELLEEKRKCCSVPMHTLLLHPRWGRFSLTLWHWLAQEVGLGFRLWKHVSLPLESLHQWSFNCGALSLWGAWSNVQEGLCGALGQPSPISSSSPALPSAHVLLLCSNGGGA